MQGYGLPSFYVEPFARGNIYGTVYLTREEFQKTVSGLFWRTKDGSFFYPRRVLGNCELSNKTHPLPFLCGNPRPERYLISCT